MLTGVVRVGVALFCVVCLLVSGPAGMAADATHIKPDEAVREADRLKAVVDEAVRKNKGTACFKSRYQVDLRIVTLQSEIFALKSLKAEAADADPDLDKRQREGFDRTVQKAREAAEAEIARLKALKACDDAEADPKTPPLSGSEGIPLKTDDGETEDKRKARVAELLESARVTVGGISCLGPRPAGASADEVTQAKGRMLYILQMTNPFDGTHAWAVEARKTAMAELDRLDALKPCPPPGVMAPRLAPRDQAVLDELNKARTDPQGYARTLHGPQATEAVVFLNAQKPLDAVAYDPRLGAAAAQHLADLAKTGQISHTGSDGSTVMVRVRRQGLYSMTYGEEISTGETDPGAVIRQLVIDATTPTRGHRLDLFNPRFVIVGIACGSHPKWGAICVIDFSIKPMDR